MTINAIEKLLNKYANGECTGMIVRTQSDTNFVIGTTDQNFKKPDSVTLSKSDMTLSMSYKYETDGIHRTLVSYDCNSIESIAVCTDSEKDPEQRARINIQD